MNGLIRGVFDMIQFGRLIRLAAVTLVLAIGVGLVSISTLAARADDAISAAELEMIKAVEQARIHAVNKVYHTVVCIYGMSRQGGGSGVIYDPEGYALTNYHVVAGAGKEGWGGLADGKLYKWKLVGIDPGGDLAIIKLEGKKKWPYAALGDSDKVRIGDFVMAMGNPFVLAEDQRPTVTLGVVSGTKRFQPGTGANGKMLEYGNCIQIDSSINPGNSGGPLFNMQGEVIGINGRGSFEERGRVNVGVGYAISVNQCKLFIPDLLSTKTSRHGTLEAVFARRGEREVVCESINLDSPIAKAGLKLGDQLLEFDGQPITATHQFTNLIATMPADYPVEVVWDNDGKRKSAWVRLSSISYPKPRARPQPRPQPQPQPKPGDGKDGKQPPRPRPVPVPRGGLKVEFGKISNEKLNKTEALRVFRKWYEFQGGDALQKIKGVEGRGKVIIDGKTVAEVRAVSDSTGRFRFETRLPAPNAEFTLSNVFDGKQLFVQGEDGPMLLKENAALAHETVAGIRLSTILASPNPEKHLPLIRHQGVGRAQGVPCHRILVEDKHAQRFILWFTELNQNDRFETRLVKVTKADAENNPVDDAVIHMDYKQVGGIRLASKSAMVNGIAEQVTANMEFEVKPLDKLPDDVFKVPQVNAGE